MYISVERQDVQPRYRSRARSERSCSCPIPYTVEDAMASQRVAGFRLGIYVFKDAEIVDFAAPHGVFSVVRRFDPALDAFHIADAMRLLSPQPGLTAMPNY